MRIETRTCANRQPIIYTNRSLTHEMAQWLAVVILHFMLLSLLQEKLCCVTTYLTASLRNFPSSKNQSVKSRHDGLQGKTELRIVNIFAFRVLLNLYRLSFCWFGSLLGKHLKLSMPFRRRSWSKSKDFTAKRQGNAYLFKFSGVLVESNKSIILVIWHYSWTEDSIRSIKRFKSHLKPSLYFAYNLMQWKFVISHYQFVTLKIIGSKFKLKW